MRLGELRVCSYRLEQGTENFFCKGSDQSLDFKGHMVLLQLLNSTNNSAKVATQCASEHSYVT